MKRTLLLLASLVVAVGESANAVDFVKDIAPIIEQRCLECHGPKKQKGKLRLDTKEAALAHVIIAGKAAESELIELISLPKDHDDIMPGKGDPLTKEQQDLFKEWINAGAQWPDGLVLGAAAAKPGAAGATGAAGGTTASDLRAAAADLRAAATRLESVANSMDGGGAPPEPTPAELAALAAAKEAEAKTIASIEKEFNVSIRPIAMNVDWKEANFRNQGTNITDAALASVGKVFTLVDVNLATTKITDAGLANLKSLTNLTSLHLENTDITDAGLAHLKGLGKLSYLNLYGTAVTDKGIEELKGLASLKKLYLWETKVTDAGVKNLQDAIAGIQISRGVDLALVRKIEEDRKIREEARKKEDEEKKKKEEAEKAKKEAEEKAKKEADDKKKAEEDAKKKEAEAKAADEAKKKEEADKKEDKK